MAIFFSLHHCRHGLEGRTDVVLTPQTCRGVTALSQTAVIAMDATHFVTGRDTTSARPVLQLVSLDPDGNISLNGIIWSRRESKTFLVAVLRAIAKHLKSKQLPFSPEFMYIDDSVAG